VFAELALKLQALAGPDMHPGEAPPAIDLTSKRQLASLARSSLVWASDADASQDALDELVKVVAAINKAIADAEERMDRGPRQLFFRLQAISSVAIGAASACVAQRGEKCSGRFTGSALDAEIEAAKARAREQTPGCMDPASANYSPQAQVDDGSCSSGGGGGHGVYHAHGNHGHAGATTAALVLTLAVVAVLVGFLCAAKRRGLLQPTLVRLTPRWLRRKGAPALVPVEMPLSATQLITSTDTGAYFAPNPAAAAAAAMPLASPGAVVVAAVRVPNDVAAALPDEALAVPVESEPVPRGQPTFFAR
jgi:hypothetical protein